ncbi:MAG: rhamnosyltransferase WsaF family glycosyltransferase [Myxococcaceae bacterium]
MRSEPFGTAAPANFSHPHAFATGEPGNEALVEMISAQRALVASLTPCDGTRCGDLVAHGRTLALLERELRRRIPPPAESSEPLRRARELADVLHFAVPPSHRARLGQAVTAAKRALVQGLSPLHIEVMRPQFRFNIELVEVLAALEGQRGAAAGGSGAPWRRRLEPLADPSRFSVEGHRKKLAGGAVRLAKQSWLKALGPLARPVLERQRRWNQEALSVLEAAMARPLPERARAASLAGALWERCDPMLGEGVPVGARVSAPLWNEVLRRQVAFNRAVTVLLYGWLELHAPPLPGPAVDYAGWCAAREPAQIRSAATRLTGLVHKPLISLVTPAYETPEAVLRECIDSVRAQSYPNWELCVADDGSRSKRVSAVLRAYAKADPRIRFVTLPKNAGIAGATNAAIALAHGEYVGFLDHDDALTPHALAEVALRLADEPEADLVYSDEDRMDAASRRFNPFFKPDWSPDLLRAVQYVCHFMVVRKALLDQVGGLREGFQGSQDYDLTLRLTERAGRIAHIPKILYHWRASPLSLSEDPAKRRSATQNGARAVQQHLERLGEEARVDDTVLTHNRVRYPVRGEPLVSIIVPFKDKPELLEQLYSSLTRLTRYPRYELLLISNNSVQPETHALVEKLKADPRVRSFLWDHPFHIPKLINFGARQAKGELLLLFNNDIEVVEPGWLDELVGNAQREEIGAVGCKLVYPSGRIQHAGVVVGSGGFAAHAFAGLPDSLEWTPFGHAGWTRNFLAVTGACLMVRRKLFEEVGGCDESFEVCGSDVDLCLRLIARGKRVLYTPNAKLVHHESASRGRDTVPEGDYWRSFQSYRPYLAEGDPFYNPNLTLGATDNGLRTDPRSGEQLALEALAHAMPSALDPRAKASAREQAHIADHVQRLDHPGLRTLEGRSAPQKKGSLERLTWLVPPFAHPFGGVHTVLRFADLLARRHGTRSHFVVYDPGTVSAEQFAARVAPLFPEPPGTFGVLARREDAAELPASDLTIATFWESAYLALAHRRAGARAYFVQDFEPLFYPAGTRYALAEQTYRLGLFGIFNSPGLHRFVTRDYPMQGCAFEPAVDQALFHPRRPARGGPTRVFFYGRPSADRNAFELGVATLKRLKERLGAAVDIVSAGERWSPAHFGVEGAITNLGVLPYEKTPELYRGCDVGLVFMFTKHPSYLPLEMMACGVTVVTNQNPANAWLLEHERNCLLCEPAVSCVVEQLRRACEDPVLRERLGAAAAERMRRTTWEEQADGVWSALNR